MINENRKNALIERLRGMQIDIFDNVNIKKANVDKALKDPNIVEFLEKLNLKYFSIQKLAHGIITKPEYSSLPKEVLHKLIEVSNLHKEDKWNDERCGNQYDEWIESAKRAVEVDKWKASKREEVEKYMKSEQNDLLKRGMITLTAENVGNKTKVRLLDRDSKPINTYQFESFLYNARLNLDFPGHFAIYFDLKKKGTFHDNGKDDHYALLYKEHELHALQKTIDNWNEKYFRAEVQELKERKEREYRKKIAMEDPQKLPILQELGEGMPLELRHNQDGDYYFVTQCQEHLTQNQTKLLLYLANIFKRYQSFDVPHLRGIPTFKLTERELKTLEHVITKELPEIIKEIKNPEQGDENIIASKNASQLKDEMREKKNMLIEESNAASISNGAMEMNQAERTWLQRLFSCCFEDTRTQ